MLANQDAAARLVARCAAGDRAALADLHALYAQPLTRRVRGFVGNAEEAEEIVQEVFLYVWQRADRYDARRAAVATWMSTIARSRAIDRLRRRGSDERTRSRLPGERPSTVPPTAPSEVLTGQRRRRLRRALRKLPAAQRQALWLAYYRGLTQSEIARHAEIPLGTVKTRTAIALGKLRQDLAPGARELL